MRATNSVWFDTNISPLLTLHFSHTGNAQPTRLSFDEVEEEKKAEHTRVRSHRLLDEMMEQEVVEAEASDEDEAHRRYRKRKVREYKDRMVQKVKEAYAGTRRASGAGLEAFARGRGVTGASSSVEQTPVVVS